MTDTAELAAAIASVKRATPETAPWSASDFSDAENPPEIDQHIATILNAVVSGDLAEAIALRAEVERLEARANAAIEVLEGALQEERALSDRLAGALEYVDDYSLSYPDLGVLSAVAQPAIQDHAIARLTAELDQALARAAAAATDMLERAAEIMDSPAQYWDAIWTGRDSVLIKKYAKSIRALDIDPDAQKALDRLLTEAEQRGYAKAMEAERKDSDQRISKAREDAIREAAHLIECDGDALGGKSGAAKAILALLTDGGRDE